MTQKDYAEVMGRRLRRVILLLGAALLFLLGYTGCA